MRLPKNGRPTPPGEVFLEEFLLPPGITHKDAAERLSVSIDLRGFLTEQSLPTV